jgi:hypothetical protein
MQGQARQGDIRMDGPAFAQHARRRQAVAVGQRRAVQARQLALAEAVGELVPVGLDGGRARRALDVAPAGVRRPGPLRQRHHARRRQVFDAGARTCVLAPQLPCRPRMRVRPSPDRRAIAASRAGAMSRPIGSLAALAIMSSGQNTKAWRVSTKPAQ